MNKPRFFAKCTQCLTWLFRYVKRPQITYAASQADSEALFHRFEDGNALLRRAAEQSTNALIFAHATDATDGLKLLYANSAFAQHLGYSRLEIFNLPVKDFTDLSRAELAEYMTLLKTEKSLLFETEHITRTGQHIPVEISLNHIVHEGIPVAIGYCRDISKRRNSEARLLAMEVEAVREAVQRKTDRRFKELFDAVSMAIIIFDVTEDGRFPIIATNLAAEQTFGINAEEEHGKLAEDLLPVDVATRLTEQNRHCVETAASVSFELAMDHPANLRVDEITLTPVPDANGRVHRIVSIANDITERKRLQMLLEEREQRMERLFDNAPGYFCTLVHHADGSYAMPFASTGIYDLFGIQPEDVAKDVSLLAAMGHPDDIEMTFRKTEESERNLTPYHLEYRIIHPQKGLRWVEVRAQPKRNSDGSTHWHGFMHDVTERKILETELARREQYQRTILDNFPYFVWLKDKNNRFLAGNRQVARVARVQSPHDLEGKTDFDFFPRDLAEKYVADDQAIIAECVTRNMEEMYVDENGERHWMETWKSPLVVDGRAVGTVGCSRDISERKQMEERLLDSKRFLSSVINSIADPILVKDRQHRWLHVNAAYCQLFGHSHDEFIGKTDFDFFPESQASLFWDAEEVVFSTGQEFAQEEEVTCNTGETLQIHTRKTRFISAHGEPILVGINSDFTVRKRMESMLLQREREFRTLVENSPNLILRFNRECKCTYANPIFQRLTEIPPYVVLDKSPSEFLTLLSGAVQAQDFESNLCTVLTTGQQIEWEFSLLKPDGTRAFMVLDCVPESNGVGEIVGTLTQSRDISARRAMEESLRMAASVFETAWEGISITDTSANIVDVNPAFLRITGFTREEVIGNNPRILSSGRHSSDFYLEMWRALREEGKWSGEIVNRRKSGDIYHELLSITSVYDATGLPTHYVAIFADISELKRQEQRLEHIAYHDVLTGLPNRMLLTDRIQLAIAQAIRDKEILAVVYLDLDGFKPINDIYGHEQGDRVLIEMAARLTSTVRASDTVSRIGGDEFVLLLVGQSSARETSYTLRRLLTAVTEPLIIGDTNVTLSASIGVSLFPEDDNESDKLIRDADQAMYVAKRSGRNQFVFYSQDEREKTKLNGQMVLELRTALEENQITVHYQPIVDLITGRVQKAEALSRWAHPERGFVPPVEFIPVAENSGLIHALGDCVFQNSVRVAQEWNRLCPPREANGDLRRIGVNRSPRQFFADEGVDSWANHLRDERISGEMLSVEITEGLLLDDRPGVLRQLNQMRALGMTLSLDDFGTGYSALSYLKKFNIDYIKIDRSFISDLTNDESDRAIVESIIAMARRLGIKLIAEGVETQAQAELLAAAGCHMAQGYLYARPMPEQQFLDFVLATEREPLSVPGRAIM